MMTTLSGRRYLPAHGQVAACDEPVQAATIAFGVNETWNRMRVADLIDAFEKSLGQPL